MKQVVFPVAGKALPHAAKQQAHGVNKALVGIDAAGGGEHSGFRFKPRLP
ncbi:hypothetical protein SDC9_179607 [bioreactor metagenome]|uniref:Uncharacterized protein n=1 Tax=bioreactor metagenome TaxID=1076179 RepID=A0A645GZ93_9ZZZZ